MSRNIKGYHIEAKRFIKAPEVILDTAYVSSGVEVSGSIFWDADNQTLTFPIPDGGRIQINQEPFDLYHNLEGSTIVNGDIVSASGASGNRTAIVLTDPHDEAKSLAVLGMVTVSSIGNNNVGRITKNGGKVRQLNTAIYSEGTILWVDTDNKGKWTSVMPSAPHRAIKIGVVVVSHAINGVVELQLQVMPRLEELSNVDGTNPNATGDLVTYDLVSGTWQRNAYNITDYELLVNKENITVDNSIIKYPTVNLLKTYADSKVSDIAYSATWDGVTEIAPSKNAIYDKISTLESVNYCATTMTVTTGTLNQGTVADLCAVGGTDVIIQERVANPPFQVDFTFTGVQRLSGVKFYGRYAGGANHNIHIEAYNYNSSSWDYVGEFSATANKQWFSFALNLPNNYLSGGTVQVRIIHQDTGIITHQMILDYINVNYGGGGGSGFITAGAVEFTPNGNLSGTNVQSAIQELDAEKEPAFTKNTAFNKNFGTTAGTVLEGRTFGTAANSAITDFAPASGSSNYIQNQNASAQSANMWISGNATIGGNIGINTNNPTARIDIQTDGFTNGGLRLHHVTNNPWDITTAAVYTNSDLFFLNGEVEKMRIDANGNSIQTGTVNTTGYLLNNNNLFSNLSSGYLPYWDGGKFLNSKMQYDGSFFKINNQDGGVASLYFVGSHSGHIDYKLENGVPGIANEGFSLYDNTNSRISWYVNSGNNFVLPSLASTNPRLLSASSTGQLTPITDGTNGQVLTTNGSGGYSFGDYSQITSGAGAPASTPAKIGFLYVDTTNFKLYFAKGTASSADWIIAN